MFGSRSLVASQTLSFPFWLGRQAKLQVKRAVIQDREHSNHYPQRRALPAILDCDRIPLNADSREALLIFKFDTDGVKSGDSGFLSSDPSRSGSKSHLSDTRSDPPSS